MNEGTNDKINSVLSLHIDSTTPMLKDCTENKNSNTKRIDSFDMLRGILMILMALDHTHGSLSRNPSPDYFYNIGSNIYISVFNNNIILSIYHLILRLLSHLCAPGFFFLMGFGMIYFYEHRRNKLKWPIWYTAYQMSLRSLIIVLLDTINFGIRNFPIKNSQGVIIFCSILYSLGFNMFIMTFVVIIEYHYKLPGIIINCVIILFSLISTNIITNNEITKLDQDKPCCNNFIVGLLWIPSSFRDYKTQIFYPIIPWLCCTAFGVIIARITKIYKYSYDKMRKIILYFAVIFMILFIIIRFIACCSVVTFGNYRIDGWMNVKYDGMEFFNLTKYPPSLVFILFNLSCCLFIVYFIEMIQWKNKIIITLGNTALFFYIIHYILIWYIGYIIVNYIPNYDRTSLISSLLVIPFTIILILIMYPLCKWYKAFKTNKSHKSLWKLF